jgi:hypothetical protein
MSKGRKTLFQKNKIKKQKGWEHGSSGCLVCVRPGSNPKNRKNKGKKREIKKKN